MASRVRHGGRTVNNNNNNNNDNSSNNNDITFAAGNISVRSRQSVFFDGVVFSNGAMEDVRVYCRCCSILCVGY